MSSFLHISDGSFLKYVSAGFVAARAEENLPERERQVHL
jgi:hypothetical protein